MITLTVGAAVVLLGAPQVKPPASCHVMRAHAATPAKRASQPISRKRMFSTDGRSIFYFGVKLELDAASFTYAEHADLARKVFARDQRDVYTQSPQSCGDSCGKGYTGYSWRPLGVKNPSAFHWLAGGYAADDRFVYDEWNDGPVAGATPDELEVLLCGDEESGTFVVATNGTHYYHDGKEVPAADAFEP